MGFAASQDRGGTYGSFRALRSRQSGLAKMRLTERCAWKFTIPQHPFCPGLSRLGYDGCVAETYRLNRPAQNRRRIFAALACLLAVVFLYAPLAGAAWTSHSMACCTGGYCNIPKHHHQKTPVNSEAGEDCGHGMAGMMNCSMSCCQDSDKPVVTSVAFVMPPSAFTSSETMITRAVERVRPIEIPRTIAPLSPPPRIDNSLL